MVGFRLGGFFSGGCPVCCCCSLRDPLRGAGVQTGVGSLALEEEEGVSWCGAREGIAAPEGVGRDCRSDLGVQVCVRVCGTESGRSGGAGRRWQAGWSRPGVCCAGCAFGKGGAVRRGRSGSGEKRPYPLSLSLRFVFSTLFCRRCALHLAPGAICASAVVGSTLADSDSVSYTPSPAPVGCSADPASLTAAPKGPLLGGLPIVSGLEGVW